MTRAIGLWMCFLVGQALYVALQMQAIARAKQFRWREIARSMGLNLGARFFLAAMLFWALLSNALAGYFHGAIAAALSQPMTLPIAGIFGFAADGLLGFALDRYLPWLRKALPEL